LNVSSADTVSPSSDKRQLRRILRARRRALSPFAQRRAGVRLAQRIDQLPWFIRAQALAFYVAADGEIDPLPLIQLAWRHGKRTFLPCLRHDRSLAFVEYRRDTPLRLNRFGIPEPWGSPAISLAQLDVVCVPLVGFDRAGGRLGMGGGFYDRTFARGGVRQPKLIGLAHSIQEEAGLPRDAWDIALRGVTTEREWIRVNRR
jgi:5-formyltetrahydrofolate cyclo-ligase